MIDKNSIGLTPAFGTFYDEVIAAAVGWARAKGIEPTRLELYRVLRRQISRPRGIVWMVINDYCDRFEPTMAVAKERDVIADRSLLWFWALEICAIAVTLVFRMWMVAMWVAIGATVLSILISALYRNRRRF
jgi:hypothetical protein